MIGETKEVLLTFTAEEWFDIVATFDVIRKGGSKLKDVEEMLKLIIKKDTGICGILKCLEDGREK